MNISKQILAVLRSPDGNKKRQILFQAFRLIVQLAACFLPAGFCITKQTAGDVWGCLRSAANQTIGITGRDEGIGEVLATL